MECVDGGRDGTRRDDGTRKEWIVGGDGDGDGGGGGGHDEEPAWLLEDGRCRTTAYGRIAAAVGRLWWSRTTTDRLHGCLFQVAFAARQGYGYDKQLHLRRLFYLPCAQVCASSVNKRHKWARRTTEKQTQSLPRPSCCLAGLRLVMQNDIGNEKDGSGRMDILKKPKPITTTTTTETSEFSYTYTVGVPDTLKDAQQVTIWAGKAEFRVPTRPLSRSIMIPVHHGHGRSCAASNQACVAWLRAGGAWCLVFGAAGAA
ncbi:hypothetical protein K456DRAFT_1763952 [Colletotrichum gloeosporioides 23]|nr:hypothetical protein K456DRAFT_1763952 [Colletotrichum gloeosporioides 23]